jgi:hypothetical protein
LIPRRTAYAVDGKLVDGPAGDLATGKAVLRDDINATVGFEALGQSTGTPEKSLMRMFGPRGNPQAGRLLAVLTYLQKDGGFHLEVRTGRERPLEAEGRSACARMLRR